MIGRRLKRFESKLLLVLKAPVDTKVLAATQAKNRIVHIEYIVAGCVNNLVIHVCLKV